MSSPLVAICIGHSRKINGRTEGGAVSVGRVSEHTFNFDLGLRVHQRLAMMGITACVVDSYEGGSYGAAQIWLARYLKERGATLAVELHFNAADSPSATGHEWLYWHSSGNGKRLAETMMRGFSGLPLKSRGVKSITTADRGADFVSKTHCPAIIAEPFFGSNPSDWRVAVRDKNKIAIAMADAIQRYLAP